MNPFKTTILILTLGLSTTAVFAGDATAPLTRTVNFAALDVTTTEGADQLYRRLNSAARQVCAHADGQSVAQKHRYGLCVDGALANAIAQVDRPLVTSIHQARSKRTAIRVASR